MITTILDRHQAASTDFNHHVWFVSAGIVIALTIQMTAALSVSLSGRKSDSTIALTSERILPNCIATDCERKAMILLSGEQCLRCIVR